MITTDLKGKASHPKYFYPVMPLCSKGDNKEMILIVKDVKKENFHGHKNCARNKN